MSQACLFDPRPAAQGPGPHEEGFPLDVAAYMHAARVRLGVEIEPGSLSWDLREQLLRAGVDLEAFARLARSIPAGEFNQQRAAALIEPSRRRGNGRPASLAECLPSQAPGGRRRLSPEDAGALAADLHQFCDMARVFLPAPQRAKEFPDLPDLEARITAAGVNLRDLLHLVSAGQDQALGDRELLARLGFESGGEA